MKAEDYLGRPVSFRQGREFVQFPSHGFMSIEALDFLAGKPWDDYALGAVHALRPSWIRVIPHDGGIHLDHHPWRVTVWLDKDDRITVIEQEVSVGLPEGCEHAKALNDRLCE